MKKTMKPGTMLNPLPAVLVSCSNKGEDNLITIAWTGIINSEPPMTYISVRKSRYSHDMIKESGEFVINLVTEAMAKNTDYCGVKSGRDVNKFKVTGFTREMAKIVDVPLVAESPLNLECVVKDVIEYPSHDMFVAEIVSVHADEQLFDSRGKFHMEKAGLVTFVHGEYFGIKKQAIGRFGYSIMKAKTRHRINREARGGVHSKKRNSGKKSR
jgi:Conserved protein/domain typically associated with flavoprotein oxygenases, DIM6/NTAB family